MALRIRLQYPTGSKLGYSIERLSDGTFYDFSSGNFSATPNTMFAGLPEDGAGYAGRYKLTLSPTPNTQFTDGDYAVSIQDQASSTIVAQLATTMFSGDDATPNPAIVLAPLVINFGFETPSVGASNFQYNPPGSLWIFSGSGISANNSAFTSGNPPAPVGTQVGVLQNTGSFSQTMNNWNAGTYTIAFQAAQRGNFGVSNQNFNVLVDGSVVGTFKPLGTSYSSYSTAPFSVLAGNHTITMMGLNSVGGDNTCFLSDIQLLKN